MIACGSHPKPPLNTEVVVREHYIVAQPDQSLRHCKERPAKPTITGNNDVAVLITDLDERGEDCSSKLDKTWQSIDQAVADAAKKNQ